MFQIGDNTLVSLDLVERFFCCDLSVCLGACCIEGDAGAPITPDEEEQIKQMLPVVWPMLLPRAREVIEREGVSYHDPEGELVTQILDGKNCVFSCYEPGGLCSCAIEKAYNQGLVAMRKPISCYLYPARLKTVGTAVTAVNYDRWKICRAAETLGRKKGIRVYQFLKEPLIERFGKQWYEELSRNCEEYIKQYLSD